MWGFTRSTGVSKTLGNNCWRFYNSDGELLAEAGAADHGDLTGLSDDDHTQYLKEKASGGLASEIPEHDHTGSSQGGEIELGGECCEPLTDGDVTSPELVFSNGDVIMVGSGGSGGGSEESAPTTIYVATTGNDSTGDGTSGNPYLTVAMALTRLPDLIEQEYLIEVADGTYANSIDISRFASTGSGKIRITGDTSTPANVSFTGTTAKTVRGLSYDITVFVKGPVVVELEGIRVNATADAGVMGIDYATVIIDRCTVTGTLVEGVAVWNHSRLELHGNISITGVEYFCIDLTSMSSGVYLTAGTLTLTGANTTTSEGFHISAKSEFGVFSANASGLNITISSVIRGFQIGLGSMFTHQAPSATISVTNASKPASSAAIQCTDLSSWSTDQQLTLNNFTNGFDLNSISYGEAVGGRTFTNLTNNSTATQNSVAFLP